MKKFSLLLFIFAAFLIVGVVNVNAETQVIEISSTSDLAKIGVDANYPLDGNYKLTNNITINETWTAIANAFTGSLDGNNNTITYTVKLGATTVPKDNKGHMIFDKVQNAEFKNIKFVVDTVNMRAPLAYYAINTSFENITITGKMESLDQMGGLVLFAQSGTTFKNVKSSVDFTLKNLDFSKYYVIVGGIVGQITTSDNDTAYEFNKGVNNKYAIVFDNSTFDGTFTTNFTNAIAGNRFYYLGGLFGATTYASPTSYFGVKIVDCNSTPTYNYTGSLPESVTQYFYVNADDQLVGTYTAGNIGGNVKPIDELKYIGRVHQNIHLELLKNGHTWTTYGYYGNNNTVDTTGGDGSAAWSKITAPSLVSVAATNNEDNGKIIGLYSDLVYEYKLKSATTFNTISNKEAITNLSAGIYEVRIKDASLTGEITEIEVKTTTAPVVNINTPKPAELLAAIDTDIANFPDDAKNAIEAGTATLVVEITPIVLDDTANETAIDEIKEALSNGEQLVAIFDIDLTLHYGDDTLSITELSTPKTFTIDIPENLQNKGYVFFLMNNHGDTVNKIDGTVSEDGTKLTFASDKFSLYALSYKLNEAANPKTSDGIFNYIILGGVGLLGLISVTLYTKKRFS
ncbi:MAG: hypothetical protein Q4G04_01940 [bacterium]|nr:hypothetical protein [bacterium]